METIEYICTGTTVQRAGLQWNFTIYLCKVNKTVHRASVQWNLEYLCTGATVQLVGVQWN